MLCTLQFQGVGVGMSPLWDSLLWELCVSREAWMRALCSNPFSRMFLPGQAVEVSGPCLGYF